MKSERVALRQPLSPLIPLCGIYLLRTSAIQARLIALGLASVLLSLKRQLFLRNKQEDVAHHKFQLSVGHNVFFAALDHDDKG